MGVDVRWVALPAVRVEVDAAVMTKGPPESPREERQRRIAEKLARRGAARRTSAEDREAHKLRELARRRREGTALVGVTWLPEPVPVMPGSRTRVVGVCSDAADEVRAAYGVR